MLYNLYSARNVENMKQVIYKFSKPQNKIHLKPYNFVSCSQEAATGPYSEPDKSNPQLPSCSFDIHCKT
jgi:hypothetical protein